MADAGVSAHAAQALAADETRSSRRALGSGLLLAGSARRVIAQKARELDFLAILGDVGPLTWLS